MESTQNNIKNPFAVNQIDLYQEDSAKVVKNVVTLKTRMEYNLIQIKDPHTYYIIEEEGNQLYLGTIPMYKGLDHPRYLLSIQPNSSKKYVIYLNEYTADQDRLINIVAYDDLEKAINQLQMYQRIGSHHQIAVDLYNLLISYIKDEINLHHFILGIIGEFYDKNDSRFQMTIEVIEHYRHIYISSEFLAHYLPKMKKDYGSTTWITEYSDLYDLLVRWDFFKKYRKSNKDLDNLDLSAEIMDIHQIFYNRLSKR